MLLKVFFIWKSRSQENNLLLLSKGVNNVIKYFFFKLSPERNTLVKCAWCSSSQHPLNLKCCYWFTIVLPAQEGICAFGAGVVRLPDLSLLFMQDPCIVMFVISGQSNAPLIFSCRTFYELRCFSLKMGICYMEVENTCIYLATQPVQKEITVTKSSRA